MTAALGLNPADSERHPLIEGDDADPAEIEEHPVDDYPPEGDG